MLDHLLGVNGLFTDLAGYARTHSIGAPGRALRYGQRTPLVLFSASRLGSHPAHPARPPHRGIGRSTRRHIRPVDPDKDTPQVRRTAAAIVNS
jgi:hypothetical protein